MSDRGCSHLDAIISIKHTDRPECAECVKIGAEWVHLRTCQQCGVTLCCDSSPNRHASKHRSEEHTSELQSQSNLVCRLLLEKKKKKKKERKKVENEKSNNSKDR